MFPTRKHFNEPMVSRAFSKVGVVTCFLFFLSGCVDSDRHSARMQSQSVRQVAETMSNSPFDTHTFEEAKVRQGVGVIVNGLATYWVNDNSVYAINGLAKTYSPGIPYGPAGLGKGEVEQAINPTFNQSNVRNVVLNAKTPPVICDEFDVDVKHDGDLVGLKLRTDLPAETVVMVRASRIYQEAAEPGVDYSIDYYSEKSTVGAWKVFHAINVADSVWKTNLATKQNEMSALGLGFDVGRVSDAITVRFVVPINQPGSLFQKNNANLEGSAVKRGALRKAESQREIYKPLSS